MGALSEHKEAAVGVLVAVQHEGRKVVALQQRADHDSFARGCQVTVHGELTPDEMKLPEDAAFSTALRRKLKEEIGDVAAAMVEASLPQAVDLGRTVNKKGRLVVTYGVELPQHSDVFLKLIVPGTDVAGFKLCTGPETLQPLEDTHKRGGVPAEETRMFPDEIASVTRFFSILSGTQR